MHCCRVWTGTAGCGHGSVESNLLPEIRFSTFNLEGLAVEFDRAVHMLCHDEVNSVAALQVRPCLIETMVYPLLVLLQATALSQGIPTVFFVDVLHAVCNAVFHKTYHVQMGRW